MLHPHTHTQKEGQSAMELNMQTEKRMFDYFAVIGVNEDTEGKIHDTLQFVIVPTLQVVLPVLLLGGHGDQK